MSCPASLRLEIPISVLLGPKVEIWGSHISTSRGETSHFSTDLSLGRRPEAKSVEKYEVPPLDVKIFSILVEIERRFSDTYSDFESTLFDPHERCEIGRSHPSSSSLPCYQALVCGTIDLEQCLGGVGPQNSRVITNRLPLFLTRVGGGSRK